MSVFAKICPHQIISLYGMYKYNVQLNSLNIEFKTNLANVSPNYGLDILTSLGYIALKTNITDYY